jgi:hypothetical protein
MIQTSSSHSSGVVLHIVQPSIAREKKPVNHILSLVTGHMRHAPMKI